MRLVMFLLLASLVAIEASSSRRSSLHRQEVVTDEEYNGSVKGSKHNSTRTDESITLEWNSNGHKGHSHTYSNVTSSREREESVHRNDSFYQWSPDKHLPWQKPTNGHRTGGDLGQGFQNPASEDSTGPLGQQVPNPEENGGEVDSNSGLQPLTDSVPTTTASPRTSSRTKSPKKRGKGRRGCRTLGSKHKCGWRSGHHGPGPMKTKPSKEDHILLNKKNGGQATPNGNEPHTEPSKVSS